MIDIAVAENILVEEASRPYLGQWNQLVSTTNWEKGRIIFAWREAMIAADAPSTEYADEAWSRRVGNVTGQHVGRLRRVYERFGSTREQYARLFWSHFQAALDWNDAEMWLEGASQSRWSISEMRRQRWQALGAPDELKPRDEDVVSSELDEDAFTEDTIDSASTAGFDEVRGAASSTSASSDESEAFTGDEDDSFVEDVAEESEPYGSARIEPVRPFANLAELPDDLSDAFESYKLSILRHKLSGWTEISRDDVLASLDALKQLALAPAE